MNYYTFDLHRTPAGGLKLLEVGGSRNGGLKFFRDGYGQARWNAVYDAYFSELVELASGKPILYNFNGPS
ncbi:MAG TPA: hypothetical protein VJB16_05340, partial [archaeon]|nr:hypothetical protein [archaeon]